MAYLFLGSNQFEGNIPPELGNLISLTRLYLGNNQLSGNIPPELGTLNNLVYLGIPSNEISGNIPPELGSLDNLELLILHSNQLTGEIPEELGNLSNLTYLYLDDNLLTGSIPGTLGYLDNLLFLRLRDNDLSGCYDVNLLNLSGSNFFISDGNNFDSPWENFLNTGAGTCSVSPCRQIDSLALLALYNSTNGGNWANTWDLNQPMETWYGIQFDGNGCVNCIDMDGDFDCVDVNNGNGGNNLTGSIPTEIGDLSNLTFLNLTSNELSDSIPNEIGNLSKLRYLSINYNSLTGILPPEIGNLVNLTHLSIGGNDLTGGIPQELESLNNLIYLSLGGNQLSDSIPPEIGNLSNLESLILSNNQLEGNIPPELGNLGKLTRLFLRGNSLSGSIPSEIGSLSNLTVLYLNSNDLNSSIPPEIGNLSNLESLVLGQNDLSGNIPSEIGNLSKLKYFHLGSNQLSGNIPPEIGNLISLDNLQLYDNNLSGSIPPEIGNLPNLKFYLSLYSNNLSGSIPPEIGNLTNLTFLYLYNNNLSGCYDESLSGLCSQLSSFNNSNYISNDNNFDIPWEDFCSSGVGLCTDPVWPGDYNYDGGANETDVLYWGLTYGNAGDIRPNATIAWQGQQAPEWPVEIKGINGKHQDGDGNGLVDDTDLQVLNANFGSIHAYNQAVYIASTLVYQIEEAGSVQGNPSYDLYIRGAEGDTIAAHGLAAVIDFEDLSVDDVILQLTNSSLSPSDTLKVLDTIENRLHLALTRTDGVNQLCDGPVAKLIIVTEDIPTNDSLKFNIETGNIVQANGDMATIASMSVYSNYPPPIGVFDNELTVGASVIHEQCNISGSVELSVEHGELPYSYIWNTGETSSSITGLTPNIYTVTVTDDDDSTMVLSVEVQGEYISIPDEFGNLPECTNSPCPTLLTPGGTVPTNTYKAGRTVSSDGEVDGAVQFKAGEIIMLQPGFKVPPNKDFSGTIEDCEN